MLFHDVVAASAGLSATRSRRAKTAILAELLSAVPASELATAVAFLTGQPSQGRIGVGWRTLSQLRAPPSAEPRLTVTEVDTALGEVSESVGSGSAARRAHVLRRLLADATRTEQEFLFRLLTGELRQGALEGVMVDAIAEAVAVPPDAVRRAFMLSGSLPTTAAAAMSGGSAALGQFGLQVGRPIRPMLASPAEALEEALAELGPVVVEYKLDGARIQVHRRGDEVHVYTRTLRDVTARVGELTELCGHCRATPWCSTGRRWRSPTRADLDRSRRPCRGSAARGRSNCARCCCGRTSSTACTSTAPTCWTHR